ncbi:hypothetical protein AMELA_G00288530 [Ameiurus melas]|uniref:Uncharacterized protein n=1 Tax=Ameiurus melas TaxID=219545 RepID=A0A7J5ZJ47_AMEME|nr:hypothetical protein AMELA_G00288530 [Ameiurus melas]
MEDDGGFIEFDVPEFSNTVLKQLNELRIQASSQDQSRWFYGRFIKGGVLLLFFSLSPSLSLHYFLNTASLFKSVCPCYLYVLHCEETVKPFVLKGLFPSKVRFRTREKEQCFIESCGGSVLFELLVKYVLFSFVWLVGFFFIYIYFFFYYYYYYNYSIFILLFFFKFFFSLVANQ